jgi:hypothetical protein
MKAREASRDAADANAEADAAKTPAILAALFADTAAIDAVFACTLAILAALLAETAAIEAMLAKVPA